MAKSRGAFARLCVRVDLCRPLRPGARICGRGAPFWQQFLYEHVEGICGHCGSLHLAGPCSPQPEASSSSLGSKFGPWMAAIRQRRSSPGSVEERRRKMQAPGRSAGSVPQSGLGTEASSARLGAEKGWKTPLKVARRRSSGPLPQVSSSGSGELPPHCAVGVPGTGGSAVFSSLNSGGVPGLGDCAGVPVSQPETSNVQTTSKFQSLNPFSLLGSDKWAGRPMTSGVTCSGPSKRARPEENTIQRTASKNSKGKGKGKLHTSKVSLATATPEVTSDSLDEVNGQCSKAPLSRVRDVASKLTHSDGHSHDLALAHLKVAICGQGSDLSTVVMEDTQLIDTSGCSVEGRPPDVDMPEDQGGSHPSPTSK